MGNALLHDTHRPAGLRRPRSRIAGFTLPELLVAVGIVSILAALAGPAFSDLIAGQRARTGATDLYLALAKARSEAIKRNANVTLSPKEGLWHKGWTLVGPAVTPGDPDITLEEHNPINGAVITGPASVVYQSTGRVRGSTQPAFSFSFTRSDAAACVKVDLSGLPTQKSSSC
jgi:type IV fimbrial biogenesis protein FimT